MNTQIVFTLSDVGKFLLWGSFLVILLYLIFILRRIYLAIKNLTVVVEENRENIDEILNTVPGITKNFEKISGDLAEDISAFNGTVSNIAGIAEKVTSIKNIKSNFVKEKEPSKGSSIVLEDE